MSFALMPVALLGLSPIAAADEFKIPEIGMSGEAAAALLKAQCISLWQPAPYITCANGNDVVIATSSAKDRIYYIQRLEPTTEDKATYATRLAAASGFDGPGSRCERNGEAAFCWRRGDGTALFAGMEFDADRLASQLYNAEIEKEDGAP